MKEIPFFPLPLIVFPQETTRLFIYEPRYKQLLNDIIAQNFPFVIPFQYEGKMSNIGSMVMLKQIVEQYDDGTSWIEITGLYPVSIVSLVRNIQQKLYDGGLINVSKINHIVKNKQLVELYCTINNYEYFEHEEFDFFEIAKKFKLNPYDKLKILDIEDWEIREKILINILKTEQLILTQEKSKWQNINLN